LESILKRGEISFDEKPIIASIRKCPMATLIGFNTVFFYMKIYIKTL
jgi:hypothetical protein